MKYGISDQAHTKNRKVILPFVGKVEFDENNVCELENDELALKLFEAQVGITEVTKGKKVTDARKQKVEVKSEVEKAKDESEAEVEEEESEVETADDKAVMRSELENMTVKELKEQLKSLKVSDSEMKKLRNKQALLEHLFTLLEI